MRRFSGVSQYALRCASRLTWALRALPSALLVLLFLLSICCSVRADDQSAGDPLAWPAITRDCKPWAFNWWPGSAVDEGNLARELQRYHDGGLGGVSITPIYGMKGADARSIPYFTGRWMQMLSFAVHEAGKLDMGIDMTTGTGWCFGGPQISRREAAYFVTLVTADIPASAAETWTIPAPKHGFPKGDVLNVIAVDPAGGETQIDNARVDAKWNVRWKPPGGGWKLVIVIGRKGPAVKRSAPGGAGPMLNPIFPAAMQKFLAPFNEAFAAPDAVMPRAMFHDSYEYNTGVTQDWGEWSPDLLEQFEKLRGYKLQEHFAALAGIGPDETVRRIRTDYHETVSDLIVDAVFPRWVAWCHQHGILTRNQAHGARRICWTSTASRTCPRQKPSEKARRCPANLPRRRRTSWAAGEPLPKPARGWRNISRGRWAR